jgi:hypothetical protein
MFANGCQQTQFAKTSKTDSENEFTNTSSDKQEEKAYANCVCWLLAGGYYLSKLIVFFFPSGSTPKNSYFLSS